MAVSKKSFSFSSETFDNHVVYAIEANGNDQHTPRDVILVVDVSGSMNSSANDKAEGVMREFSKMDVVKHALRTLVASLGPDDRCAMFAFESHVYEVLPFTPCTSDGKRAAAAAIDGLNPGGTTALWDGLRAGLERAKECRAHAVATVILFTDGLPNPSPSRGELAELQAYLSLSPATAPPAVHTFGIGYDLNSLLLETLSQATGGTFNFIPDGGMVGTVVINALANAAAIVASCVCVRFSGIRISDLSGGLRCRAGPNGTVLAFVGDLRSGQPRHLVVKKVPTEVTLVCGDDDVATPIVVGNVEAADHIIRAEFVDVLDDVLHTAMLDIDAARALVSIFVVKHKRSGHPTLEDARGQVAEALSKMEYYTRWGVHYLYSLKGAHRDERCNNFKDASVQAYGGTEFKALRDAMNAIFETIEVPTPSLASCRLNRDSIPAQGFVSAFNNASNGCFAPGTLVLMEDGTSTAIERLGKASRVKTPQGASAVVCVTEHVQARDGQGAEMVTLENGPTLTPWHPVKCNDAWVFPVHVMGSRRSRVKMPVVYNVVLEQGHTSLFADGIEAVTLGHGLQDTVAAHAYFGTYAVVRDLRATEGWDEGRVVVRPSNVVRDAESGLVCQIV